MYALARDWGIQPSEFWGMTIHEWFTEHKFRKAQSDKLSGKMTDATKERMAENIQLTDEEFLRGTSTSINQGHG